MLDHSVDGQTPQVARWFFSTSEWENDLRYENLKKKRRWSGELHAAFPKKWARKGRLFRSSTLYREMAQRNVLLPSFLILESQSQLSAYTMKIA